MPPSHDDGNHVDSSGEDLTPPPHSPEEPNSPSAQVAHDLQSQHAGIVVAAPPPPVQPPIAAPPGLPEKPPRKKPGRKPGWSKLLKEANAANAAANGEASTSTTTTTSNPDAPKKRGPRKSKDATAPPTMLRRKRKTESLDPPAALAMAAQTRAELQPRPSTEFMAPPEKMSEMGNGEAIHRPPAAANGSIQSFFAPQAAPPPPPPPPQPVRTSGQNYDPIRSNYDPVRETIVTHSNPFSAQGSPNPNVVPPINRASASPSISSLVDPPSHALTSPSIAAQSFFNQQARQRDDSHNSVPPSPQPIRVSAPAVEPESPPVPKPQPSNHMRPRTPEVSMPVNGSAVAPLAKKIAAPGSTATSSTAASPKVRPKDKEMALFPAPPPLPGQGLMQGGGNEFRAPTVILSIPMNGEVNKYINFTRLAEERYGWDALHPRLAAQRDRLARVAAAGAALERNGSSRDSGDDMSLDSEAEAENSNVEMGGMSDGRTGTDGGAKKIVRKRKNKEDEYDKDDGFVDDSELLWEEQAAAANDGFFVYSGPLVPEAEKPAPELRGDGSLKRGRGGRGSRGGRVASSTRGAAHPKPGREGLPMSGPGSRGGSTTRKPRITKADRARMEQEKLERERMGAASMHQPTSYGGMIPLSGLGTTPMVFNN